MSITAYNLARKVKDDPMKVTHIYVKKTRKEGGKDKYRCAGESKAYGNKLSVYCKESKAKSLQAKGIKIQPEKESKEKAKKPCTKIAKSVERKCRTMRAAGEWKDTGYGPHADLAFAVALAREARKMKKKTPTKKVSGEKKKKSPTKKVSGEKKKKAKKAKKSITI